MGDNFLGVQLPDNFGSDSANTGLAPESNEQSISKDNQSETTSPTQKELMDLDKLERFRFQGKEWTAKDLRSAYMRQQDYTKKTQELSETRKYAENFDADLQSVLENPQLLNEMRTVYPPSYVAIAEKILSRTTSQKPSQEANPVAGSETQIPKEFLDRFSKLENTLAGYEREKYQAEIAKNEAWLDKTYSNLSKKYPHAHEEVVTARAAFLRERGHEINDKVLENIFREVNKNFQERYVKATQKQQSEQLSTNLRAKDIGAGGGIPGSPPVKPKNFAEARNAALEHFTGKSR